MADLSGLAFVSEDSAEAEVELSNSDIGYQQRRRLTESASSRAAALHDDSQLNLLSDLSLLLDQSAPSAGAADIASRLSIEHALN